MALSSGTRLGAHEILGLLGAGGMGEVYRAHDTRLNRQVAIKVLPEPYAGDPDRVARFQREAQAVAALNHPNIAAIYELAESGGMKFLVLELVEGDTLAERLKRGPIAIDEALGIIKQILEALEVAHEKGICHRDLKPANVKLTPEGAVKVLDFGLAKFLTSGGPAASNLSMSPTLSVAGTYPGVILGTAGYMSPEQARGFEADHRSDLFSIGCILYEVLTGRQAFEGETASDILASVLKSDVEWSALPKSLNPRLIELLRRCLEKSPKKRWHAAADVRVEIETLIGHALVDEPGTARAIAAQPWWRRALLVAAGVLIGGLAAGAAMWLLRTEPARTVARFTVTLPEGQLFTNTGRQVVALSPDGETLVYVANQRLYRRSMGDLEPRVIAGSESLSGVLNPVFSPDGQSIAYYNNADRTLKRIAVGGGAPVTVCETAPVFGLSWDEHGILVGQGPQGILRVSAGGGVPEVVAAIEGNQVASMPQMLPGGKALMFSVKRERDEWDAGQVVAQVIGGERKTLMESAADGRYLPTGHLVFARAGVLLAVPFDVQSLAVDGVPTPVIEGIRRTGLAGAQTGAAQFAVAASGALAYLPGPAALTSADSLGFALFNRKGDAQLLKAPPGSYRAPRVSPDGRWVAFGIEDDRDAAVWIYEIAGSTAARRLTFGGRSRSPIWSPDGQWIAFESDREGDEAIFRQRADGNGVAVRLTKPEKGTSHIPQSWSPDGAHLLFTVQKEGSSALWTLSLKDQRQAPYGDVQGAGLTEGAFSPDGRWVAYSVRQGTPPQGEVFLQPFPSTGAKYLVHRGGHAYWTAKGDALIINAAQGSSVVVPVTTSPHVAFGQPVDFPRRGRSDPNPATNRRNSDSMPDGEHVLGLTRPDATEAEGTSRQILITLNWLDEVKRLVPRP